jgi:penicillin-binding protein 1B
MAPRKPKSTSSRSSRSGASKGTTKKTTSTRSRTKTTKPNRSTKPPARRKMMKAPAKKRPRRGPQAKAKARTQPLTWRQWFTREALVWGGGVAAGLTLAGAVLWTRAVRDVEAYLASPPSAAPGVVWSAPMEVREGQRASMASMAGDLLAAGYVRVDRAGPTDDGPGSFSVRADGFDVWSAPGGGVDEGEVHLELTDGVVASIEPGRSTRLHPTVLATIGDLDSHREPVQLEQLSKWVEPALLSMEDTRFRQHRGIDPIGLLRALAGNLTGGRTQGGSTLTQQLAKNLFLSSERRIQRKVREAFFAAALEAHLSKDELLELYLSEVYLGQMGGLPVHGVSAAARAWFGRGPGELEAHEAATLVGVIPAPNAYSPVRHPETARERRDLVLRKMHARGHLDDDQLAVALAKPLQLRGLEPSRVRRAPYAVDLAVDAAEHSLGEGALATGGFQVRTGIQPLWQRAAEEAVSAGMAALEAEHPDARGAQVALVAVRIETGEVVALVGGRSYATSPFNRASAARRQAGSTVKPFTLLAGLDAGLFTPATRLDDRPITRTFDGTTWTPRNYDGRFVGDITVRRAIETSRNIPAVLMAEQVGPVRLQRFARGAGLSEATNLPSAALGGYPVTPLELAGAYTVFHDGAARTPRIVESIDAPDGQRLLHIPPEATELASPVAAAQALAVLQGVLSDGTGRGAARYGVTTAAGKSGTTDGYRDAWFAGLTPELAVAVWVGRDEGTLGLSGSRAALPVWARFVAASGTAGAFERPAGLEEVALCSESGRVARDACASTYTDLFPADDLPDDKCDLHGAPLPKVGRLLGRLFGGRDAEDAPVEE